jgi:hypothetical protein
MPDNASREAFRSEGGLPVSALKGLDLSEEQLKSYRELAQNGADNTTVGVTVRYLGKDRKEEGRQEVVVFTRSGADMVSTMTYLILPDSRIEAVRMTLRNRENAKSKAQQK